MIRTQINEKAIFSATVSSYAKGVEAKLSQRRKDMDEKWDEVDRGWDILKQRMAGIGITKPASSNESLVQLNVGGSHLNIRRSVLASAKRSAVAWNLADLFDSVWDERVPRDKDGRIVLDESPVCVKRLMHMLLNTSAGTSSDRPGAGDAILAGDEPYLAYVSRALGLSDPLPEWGIDVVGGSTILEPHGLGPLSATLQGWCPDTPDKLELVYTEHLVTAGGPPISMLAAERTAPRLSRCSRLAMATVVASRGAFPAFRGRPLCSDRNIYLRGDRVYAERRQQDEHCRYVSTAEVGHQGRILELRHSSRFGYFANVRFFRLGGNGVGRGDYFHSRNQWSNMSCLQHAGR
ncbi:unnamed protein product [Ectocarpus sp. 8 AP-2014]